MIKDPGEFVRRRGDGLGGAELGPHPAEEGPKDRLAAGEALGGKPQGERHPLLYVAGPDRQDLPAGDPIIGAEAEPGRKVVAGGERGEIGAQLREQGVDRGSLEAGHLREIGAEDPVELGPEIEAGRFSVGFAAGAGGWRDRSWR